MEVCDVRLPHEFARGQTVTALISRCMSARKASTSTVYDVSFSEPPGLRYTSFLVFCGYVARFVTSTVTAPRDVRMREPSIWEVTSPRNLNRVLRADW